MSFNLSGKKCKNSQLTSERGRKEGALELAAPSFLLVEERAHVQILNAISGVKRIIIHTLLFFEVCMHTVYSSVGSFVLLELKMHTYNIDLVVMMKREKLKNLEWSFAFNLSSHCPN